jgi:hypothetical protein
VIGLKYVGGNESSVNCKAVDQINLTLYLLNSSLHVKSNNYSFINNGSFSFLFLSIYGSKMFSPDFVS